MRRSGASGIDPWAIEAERAAAAPGFRRPDPGPVPRRRLFSLGLLAAFRALGLVLVAEAVARGITALGAGGIGPEATRLILSLGIAGALLRAGAEWATAVLARRIASGVKTDLRGRLWRRITRGGADGGGTAVLAADGLDDLDDYYTQSLPSLVAAAVVPLLVGVRILGADWLSALVIVVTVPLVPLFMTLIGKHTQQRTDAALTALTRLGDHLAELARGLPVLVGLGRVERQTQALDGIQREYRARTQETLRWAFLSALALELVATISVAVVAVFLGLRLLNGTIGLEAALVALILAPECFAALREVGTAFHASQDGLSALERATRLIARPAARDVRTGPAGAIRLEGLAVRYAGRAEPALRPVDAELSGVVSIAGPSGAGKSTLLAALAGTLPDDAQVSGRVVGVDPAGVGWAPQAPHGFAATPRAELALYGADPEPALAELGLLDRADAAIAELSPGEQRRLAVARAFARVDAGAGMLVLDEPTAHLDSASAELVRAAILRRAGRAVVVLASHEPETLALATATVPVAGPAAATPAAAAASPLSPIGYPFDESPSENASSHVLSTSGYPLGEERGGDQVTRRRPLTLFALLRPQLWSWLGAVGLAAIATGLGLALTAVSGWLIVRASVEEYIMYLLVAIVGVRAFGIGRSVGRYAERLATHRAAFRAVDALRLRLWRAIAARGAGSRRLLEGGAPLDYLVTLADDLRDQLPRVVAPLVVGLLVVAGAGVTTAFVVPQLTWLVVAVLAVATAAGAALAVVSARGSGAAGLSARSGIVRGTTSLAAAAGDLRGNGRVDAALADLDTRAAALARAERRSAWSAGLGAAVVTAGATGLAVVVPVLSGGAAAESASVVALLSLAVLEPLAASVAAAHRLPALRAALARLGDVLRPAPQPEWGDGGPGRPVAEVALDDVAIGYPGATALAVDGVDGAARRGRWLVLDGPSGAGKSTVLSAVMGALPLARGAVRADGAPLTAFRERAWKDAVAWCPQDAYVFDSTLRGNLLLADASADDAALEGALRLAGLSPLLSALDEGLDARVGAGGSALSGGERQRLAVARALLSRADVVLLDEPTAHLDAPTAAAMMTDVRAATRDRVVVLVSHRMADRHAEDAVVRL
ncbi:thiol reductant ABC exporter subunit CydC [Microbacterium gilvum]|uniref:Thiol reductant ABC exporter subunit CydD n=1 Tax=Microbacterium gilvum TaxID=1336204 RepID=A0ABP9AKI1_9MICO